jgi:fucose permease
MFSQALLYKPERENEISGLMIMGLAGGAIFPLLMGVASDAIGSQLGAIFVISVCVLYLLFLSTRIKKIRTVN